MTRAVGVVVLLVSAVVPALFTTGTLPAYGPSQILFNFGRPPVVSGTGQRWGLRPPSDQVRRETAALWNLLQLWPAARVIDIACGHGRHALELAQRGADVIGFDFAVTLLNRARWIIAEHGSAL
jgi:SAM-dependent methyltransferase